MHFGQVTGKKILGTVLALVAACLIEASSDWVGSLVQPRLTIGAIVVDAVGLLAFGFIVGVPVTMLFWNKLVAPVFEVRKITYLHGLILVTVIYWIGGI